ncbi:cysteine-rich receptor-like protein kinase 43 [Wolffia australiana]
MGGSQPSILLVMWLSCCGVDRRKRRSVARDEADASTGSFFLRRKALEAATDGFSDENRLGHGGFGPVYKGMMPDGKEIAVKKLALNSQQGLKEFINEVKLLLKIQHKNLVSLLGCCTEGDEKMLIYEFLPNRSLDLILFDRSKSWILPWGKRFEIIKGIARGLLYLHEESPVKIIHRDIKAGNILLDKALTPKISDFGIARLFENDETHVSTFGISGTCGYMAPEYACSGYLSVKTDVFSFGVLVLEILAGRRNLDLELGNPRVSLLSYAWRLSEEGNPDKMIDPSMGEWDKEEVLLCVKVGLLCCQVAPTDRPTMAFVCRMLSGNGDSEQPWPRRPGTPGRVAELMICDNSSMAINAGHGTVQ